MLQRSDEPIAQCQSCGKPIGPDLPLDQDWCPHCSEILSDDVQAQLRQSQKMKATAATLKAMEGRCEDCEKLAEIKYERCKRCLARFVNARQIAFVIDFAITGVALFAVLGLLWLVANQLGQPWETIFGLVGVAGCAAIIILFFLRDPFSPGKRATGLVVIDTRTGRPCTFRQSGLRNLALPLIFVIPLMPLIASRNPRRLGDKWAGTRVVWKRKLGNATGGDAV